MKFSVGYTESGHNMSWDRRVFYTESMPLDAACQRASDERMSGRYWSVWVEADNPKDQKRVPAWLRPSGRGSVE